MLTGQSWQMVYCLGSLESKKASALLLDTQLALTRMDRLLIFVPIVSTSTSPYLLDMFSRVFSSFLILFSSSSLSPLHNDADLCGYTLVFADEFDELSVSDWDLEGKRWIAHTPWAGDFGDAKFINNGPDGPFTIQDGMLVITARQDENGNWTSGLLAAADKSGQGSGTQYGYFEAHMKMPSGPGTWPAFWLISLQPTDSQKPRIEVDVAEYYGHRVDGYQVADHIWFAPDDLRTDRGGADWITVPARSLETGFNTFGALVQPDWTIFYLNRQEVVRRKTHPEHAVPLYPLVNLALGSGYPIDKTPNPSRLLVDYIRIYEKAADPTPEKCKGGLG